MTLISSLISNAKETTRNAELVHEDSDLLSQANELLDIIL